MNIIQYLLANWHIILLAVVALINAVIGVALLIPGDQPEKALQAVVDFLAKFSAK